MMDGKHHFDEICCHKGEFSVTGSFSLLFVISVQFFPDSDGMLTGAHKQLYFKISFNYTSETCGLTVYNLCATLYLPTLCTFRLQ